MLNMYEWCTIDVIKIVHNYLQSAIKKKKEKKNWRESSLFKGALCLLTNKFTTIQLD